MDHGQELGDLNNRTHPYVGTYTAISGSRHRHKDENTLARLGKKQVLKVGIPIPIPISKATDSDH